MLSRSPDHRFARYRLPLHQKALAFLHRDVDVPALSSRTGGPVRSEAVVLKLLAWTHATVWAIPEGFSVVADRAFHTWPEVMPCYRVAR